MRIDARQRWVDAAVAELQHQLGRDAVAQSGTRVNVDGVFKMTRVLKAAMCAAFEGQGHIFDALVDTLADSHVIASETRASPDEDDFIRFHALADTAMKAKRDAMLRQLDPLP